MFIAFIVIVLGLFWCMVYEIQIYTVGFIVIGIIALMSLFIWLVGKAQDKVVASVVRAELIYEVPVYKEIVEHTGFSISWRGSGRNYYRFKKVLDHYECKFRVLYKNGRTGTLTCTKDTPMYNNLMMKK